MTVTELLQDLMDAQRDGLPDDAPVFSLLDLEGGERTEVPIIDIHVDHEPAGVHLLPKSGEDEVGLGIAELAERLKSLGGECGSYEVTAPGETVQLSNGWSVAPDLPIVGIALNAEAGRFGVMPWFEGCGSFFGES